MLPSATESTKEAQHQPGGWREQSVSPGTTCEQCGYKAPGPGKQPGWVYNPTMGAELCGWECVKEFMKPEKKSVDVGASLHKKAQGEPSPEQYGQLLYYDSTYKIFTLVDTRAEEGERMTTLGPIGETALSLQHEYGLTHTQADEAVGRAFHNLNSPINLDWVRRTAQAQAEDTEAVEALSEISLVLGDEAPEKDEDLIVAAAKVAEEAQKIASLVENGLTGFRWSLSAASDSERKDVGRQIKGFHRILAATREILAQGFEL